MVVPLNTACVVEHELLFLREDSMNIILPPADIGEDLRLRSIRTLLDNHKYLMNFLFNKDRTDLAATPTNLICAAGGFSHGEIILILIALDIWCGDGSVSINEAFQILDKQNWRQFVNALTILGEVHGR